MRCGAKGFTLLELLVVLALVGLLTAVVVPRIGGAMPGLQLRTAVRKVAASLRYAAQRAMAEQVAYRVGFDEKTGRVTLSPVVDADRIPDPEGEPASPSGPLDQWQLAGEVRLHLPQARGFSAADDDYAIIFYPGGGGSGGALRLAVDEDRQMEIRVDFVTSDITVHEVRGR